MTVAVQRPATHPWLDPGFDVAEARPPAREVVDVLLEELEDIPFPRRPIELQPFVLPRHSYDELFRAGSALLDLLRRIVLGIASTRTGRLEALGVDESEYPLFIEDEHLEQRYAACMARPDAVVGAEGPKFLEFNVSGAIGNSVQTCLVTRAWQRAYGGAAEVPFTGYDLFEERARLFESVCAELGVERRLAWVGSTRDLFGGVETTRYYDVEVDYLRRAGFEAEHFEPEDLLEGLGLPGELRYPVGLRQFTVVEWEELGIDWEPVRRALDAGCLLLATQSSSLIANKKVMAWASEGVPGMSAADRELVRRYLPWTRIVRDGRTEWRGRSYDLPELLVDRREQFVLKKGIGMKGLQVTMGRVTGDAEWRAAVERAVANDDTIVQEYVEAARCPMDIVDEPDGEPYRIEVAPILSPFLFRGRGAGCLARYFTTSERTGPVSIEGYGALMNVALRER